MGIPVCETDVVIVTLDELEAMRYADYECYYHERGAEEMEISRQTFGNILGSGRKKVVDALLHGKVIRIEGGSIIKEEKDESSDSGS
jgi:predicted DNA-binding protein (UPF0251 family)